MLSPPSDVAGCFLSQQYVAAGGAGVGWDKETLDIQALWRAGKSVSEIARVTGRNGRTVRRLIHQGASSPRAPRLVSSKLDPFRDYLLQRLLQDQGTNAAVLFDELRQRGYAGGPSILWEFLQPLRDLDPGR